MKYWRFKKKKLFIASLICLWLIMFSYQNTLAADNVVEFLRKNIQAGSNIWECQTRISKEANFVNFKLLQRTTTPTHTYELWSVTVSGVPCYRLFVDNGIIQSVTEHPGLR